MIKIRIVEYCFNNDTKSPMTPGHVIEVSEFEAARLCAGNFAVPVIEDSREKQTAEKREKRIYRRKK